MSLILHYHPLSSFCWKVLAALYEAETPFEGRLVNLGDPAQRTALVALWPTGKMPLLEDSDAGRVVPETSIIIEYLDRYAGAAPLLLTNVDARLTARLWDRLFDLYGNLAVQAIVADRLRPEGERDPVAVAQGRANLRTLYALVEDRMGEGPWAAGEAFSIAECAALPALFYAHTLEPFPVSARRLAAYFERLLAWPSAARVLEEARPWFEYYPFAEAVPDRFRAEPATPK